MFISVSSAAGFEYWVGTAFGFAEEPAAATDQDWREVSLRSGVRRRAPPARYTAPDSARRNGRRDDGRDEMRLVPSVL